MNLNDLLLFWAKSEESGQEPAFHPILYHLIDVAAAAEAILEMEGGRIKGFAEHLHVDAAALSTVMIRLIALHDIGKFSRAFQAKRPDLWPSPLGTIEPRAPDIPHTDIGFQLLTDDDFDIYPLLAAMFPAWRKSLVMRLVAAAAGHHGEPADETPQFDAARVIGPSCALAARNACREILGLWKVPDLPRLKERDVAMLSWALAGLTVLADWVGSNRKWFPTVPPGLGLLDYLNTHARPRACRAVQDAGIMPASAAPFTEFCQLFPAIDAPSPVQDLAQHLPLPAGPVLVLVEDATGSGKTEAAMFLAHRLMRDRGSHGLYVALPTMATANAMYGRLQMAYRRLFDLEAAPSLVLAHGRRRLHQGFRDSILEQPDLHEGSDATNPADVPAAVFCSAWIADDRRKAFLANVGVGTVDQALLAVLPSRHQSLRLWGLADRVLIVDEAHAYDPYMARELETLLEFQSALGGSAIVLSATLPNATRLKIINAFQRGLGERPSDETTCNAYPLVTVVGQNGVDEHPTGLRPQLARSVTVKRLEGAQQAVASICEVLTKGAAALWVRNTVDEAISAIDLLRQAGVAQPMLFHARFAMGDRLAIEEKVLARFGRERPQRYPGGAVLVATQVVEQSLDLDFDLVVSDLAPIDLLIQRAGRLWRHMDRRPQSARPSSGPRFLVLSPDPTDNAPADWIRRSLPGTAAVYPDPKLLWTSMKALVRSGAIVTAETASLEAATTGNVRYLVESVYSATTPWPVPDAIVSAAIKAEGEAQAARSSASFATLKLEDGYSRRGPWDDDARVVTRLGDDTTTLRLARIVNGRVVPWCQAADTNDPTRDWALSEITVRRARITGVPNPTGWLADTVAAAKATWSRYDRNVPILTLDGTSENATGVILGGSGQPIAVHYSMVTGLSF
jgi:CRISPR-associated endonuclease/helicase Cas3